MNSKLSVKGKYIPGILGEVHVTTLSGKQHLLHAMWSSFATPERQHHLWNLWMGRNNKSHNSPLKCHQFLERMLSSAILGALVKSPEGNWCWTWSKKVRKTHTIQVPFIESQVVLYYLILLLVKEILHHLGCIKTLQIMGYLPYELASRISSINHASLLCCRGFRAISWKNHNMMFKPTAH